MNARRLATAVLLAAALAAALAAGFWPHLSARDEVVRVGGTPWGIAGVAASWWTGDIEGYRYPVHADETSHWRLAAAIERAGVVELAPGPAEQAVHKRGFHLLLAEIHLLTGVPYLEIVRFLPGIWAAFTAFAVYAMLRPHPGALPAAILVAAVPTTPRFLGPAFLVPVSFALAWTPVAVVLATAARRSVAARVLLGCVLAWSFVLHTVAGATALAASLGVLYAQLRDPSRPPRPALVATAGGVAAVAALLGAPLLSAGLRSVDRETLLTLAPHVFDLLGPAALALWAAAVAWAVLARPRPPDGVAALAVVGTGAAAVVAWTLAAGSAWNAYDRAHNVLFFTMAPVLGWAAGEAARLAARRVRRLPWRRAAPLAVLVALLVAGTVVGAAALPGLPARASEQYYATIHNDDWAAMNWVAANLGPEYEVFLAEPFASPVVEAVTGKTGLVDPLGYRPLTAWRENGRNETFLLERDVTFVLGVGAPEGPTFVKVAPGVFAVDPEVAKAVAAARAEPSRD